MKKITHTITCILLVLFAGKMTAQLSGVYTIPGSYASISAAIADLNSLGVTGAVTINIAAGYTETAPANGYILNTITGASATNQITFQKSGAGANPLITAATGGTSTPSSAFQDGIWRFVGTDYVTINGIDLTDPNAANPATMEFGYGFFKASATNGCQNNTIRNCVITLNRINNANGTAPAMDGSRGIDVVNATTIAHTTALSITNATGGNSNNKFYSNTIQNCNIGIAMIGFTDATPFSNADTGNDIGGASSATGNSIINYGGGGTTNASTGVRTTNQYNVNVSYNTINNNNGSGVNHGIALRGIFMGNATSANVAITNNTITLSSGGTTQALTAIDNSAGSTAASNSVSINGNVIANCTYTGATSAAFNGILSSASCATLSMSNNVFNNNSISGTSSTGGFINNSASVGSVININSNAANGFTFTGVNGGSFNFVYNSGGASTAALSISSNSVQNLVNASTGSTGYVLHYNGAATLSQNFSNNIFTNLNVNTTGSFAFMSNDVALPTGGSATVNNNAIVTGFNKPGSGGTVTLYLTTGGPSSVLGTIKNHLNNNFSNITLAGSTTMNGWLDNEGASGGGSIKTIANNTFTNWVCGTGAVSVIQTNWSSAGTSISSNTIINIAGGGQMTGITLNGSNSGSVQSVASNVISGMTSSISPGGLVYALNIGATSVGTLNINNNSVSGLSSVGASAILGIYAGSGSVSNIFKNKFSDMQINNAGGSISGLYVAGGSTVNVYNNLIGDLRGPIANGIAISGMYIAGSTLVNAHYNTVNLAGTSSGTNFGSAAIFASTTPSLVLRDNIFVNNTVPTGAGFVYGYFRNSTTLGTYLSTSNNNLFYAGTPSANNLLFYDGTNSLPTLALFKALMSTRDQVSVTENPTFVSTAGSNANFLKVSTTVPTQIESGGTSVSTVSDDFAGTARNASTPDIGAYEGTYVPFSACGGAPATPTILATLATVCPSVTVNLYTSTNYTTTGITYQWLASTTNSSSGYSAVLNATTSALTNTNLTATTWYQLAVTCGASTSTSTPVQVTLGPPVLTTVSSATTFCSGLSVNLSLTPPTLGLTYQWMASSTNSASGYASINNATLSTLTNTTGVVGNNWYEAVIACSANTSLSVATLPVQVLEKATPTATAGVSSNTVCYNTTFNLIGGTDIGTTFSWTGPNSYTSNVQSPTAVSYTAGGAAGYSLVTSVNGCTSTAAGIVVNSLGNITGFVPTATPTTICAGSTSTLQVPAFLTRVNLYNFIPSTGASLIPLSTGSTQAVGINVDDAASGAVSIGFTFNFNGVDYTQFIVSPDGWLRFGSAAGPDEYSNAVTATNNIPKLYPYWDDLATGNTGYVRTQLIGSAPNRTMVIEWYVTIPRNTTGNANSTFQALLVEGSNSVEFRYGTMGSSFMSASSGLTGSSSVYNSVTVSNNSNSTSSANDSNSGQPASGTSYLFTLPVSPTYTWAGNSLSGTSGLSVTATPAASSVYSLNLTYQTCPTTRTLALVVSNNPTVSVSTTNTNVCSGTSATLTASGATTYTWNTAATTSAIVVSPTANTSYTVTGTNGACPTSSQVISLTASPSPTVTISGSSGICTGQTATLTASGANTYSWNTGSTSATITDSPSANTTYTVTGTDNVGCKNTTTQLVTVAAGLNIQIAGSTTVCSGQSANLTASGGVTYTWSTGATTSTLAPVITANTTYSVIGASGTCSNTASRTVSVVANPTITASGNATICAGSPITLTVTGAATYSWNTSPTTTAITVSPVTTTNYTVAGTNTLGCSVSSVITVNTNTVPVITLAQTANTVCVNTPVTFTASGANSYTWTGGPTTAINTVTPTANTVYTVTGINAAGCTAAVGGTVTTISLPVITIAPSSATICFTPASSVSLVASGANTYVWAPAGSTTATNVVNPSATTIYTVTGTATTNCVNTKTVSVVSNSVPVLSIAPAVTATVCSLAGATFTASGATSYTWSSGSLFANVSVFPSANTVYTVTGKNALNCTSTSTVAVTTLSLPVITLAPGLSTVCPGSTNTYTATGGVSYIWNNNTSTISTASFSTTTISSYSVAAIGANGCISGTQAVVFVYSLPTIAVAASDQTVCALTPVSFTASGANTYSWNTAATGSVLNVTPATSTVYTVTGTATLTGCSSTQTAAIATNSLPAVVATPASTTVCLHTSVGLTASGANVYQWNTGSNLTNINVTPIATTSYTVTGTNTLTGCSNTVSATVTVNQLPVINVSPASATICSTETIAATFTASGATSYAWAPGSVNTDTFAATPTIATVYTVTGTDANGCVGKTMAGVEISTCDGIKNTAFASNAVSLYPNPSNGAFTAKFEFEGTKTITITNSIGQLITQTTTANTSETFNLSGVAKGVYFVKVSTKQASGNYKIVIE